MKRILFILLLFSAIITINGQELTVKSFTERTNDISARTSGRVDANGDRCALVKVQLASAGANFSGMVVGDSDFHTNEYWVYMAKGSRRLTVNLQNFLPLEVEFADYGVKSLAGETTYQLVVLMPETGQKRTVVTQQYVMFDVEPKDAVVEFDGSVLSLADGTASVRKPFGVYNYRVQAALHHPSSGVVKVSDPVNKHTVSVKLAPAYGYLSVPAKGDLSGASVYVNDELKGTVPYKSGRMASGSYVVRIVRPLYSPIQQTVTIEDDKTYEFAPELSADFAEITLSVGGGAEIWVNNERKGNGTWTGRLASGSYMVECKKTYHKSTSREITVTPAMMGNTIELEQPVAITGSIDIVSSPANAQVSIDGKVVGTTPLFIPEYIIGGHDVVISRDGYSTHSERISLEEGGKASINASLSSGRPITISCATANAHIFVDGNDMGASPFNGSLSYGSHKVYAKVDGKETAEWNVEVPNDSGALQPLVLSFFENVNKTITVKGVTFTMVAVEGGTFTMGATPEQGSDAESDEKPTHQVTLSNYYIGETEVTQALWKAVMIDNVSHFSGDDNLPVEDVSWDNCQAFIRKLNKLTGLKFRLPTEAEWEFAARGGKKSQGYKYSGSNNIGDVAWYKNNSGSTTHPVKTKQPNELGIYDMSGNVWEWCQDWHGDYSGDVQTNPTGPDKGSYRVTRGCGWLNDAGGGRTTFRNRFVPNFLGNGQGFRLSLSEPSPDVITENFVVNGVQFNMVVVDGGTFTMGATPEQGSDAQVEEKPAHQVTLSDYYIGETEVTQALWQAVMGKNPSKFKGENNPVENVSWEKCQEFLKKLNALTGKNFRLPTEAEWEFAARGGTKSRGYKYCGGNTIDDVGWYDGNSRSETHPVKTKQPNELGIYDMSGNVWEWCQDLYGSYGSDAQTNPTGPMGGSNRVYRGGSWNYSAGICRSARRLYSDSGNRYYNLGLRLVLSKPTQKAVDINVTTGSITVNDVVFKMVAVEGGTFTMGATPEQGSDIEKPTHQVTLSNYYIGETEVTQELWRAIMGNNPSHFKRYNNPVEQVSWDDCQEFIKKLNALTGLKFRLPTEAEWEYAARGGKKSRGYKYSGSNNIDNVAWNRANSERLAKTHKVGTKSPNELGIYDMSGNVDEWCQDWYGSYSSEAQTNPKGPNGGNRRVNRGGNIYSYSECRSSYRESWFQDTKSSGLGFRLVLSELRTTE